MTKKEIQNCNDNNIKFAIDFKEAEKLMYEYAKLNRIFK